MNHLVDVLQKECPEQRTDVDSSSLGVAVRVQLLVKLFGENAEQVLEYDVLSARRRQGKPHALPAPELARSSMLTSGTVTTRIDGLERRNLVKRVRDSSDRRVVRISLTAPGLKTIDDAISARVASAHGQLLGLSPKERVSLTSTLRRILHVAATRTEHAEESACRTVGVSTAGLTLSRFGVKQANKQTSSAPYATHYTSEAPIRGGTCFAGPRTHANSRLQGTWSLQPTDPVTLSESSVSLLYKGPRFSPPQSFARKSSTT